MTKAVWRKAARSNPDGNCVEVAQVPGVTGVRDSKDATGPALLVTPTDWHTFTTAAKTGTFTR
ncbi:DUF397 domain-containing protein [Longispora urticae]